MTLTVIKRGEQCRPGLGILLKLGIYFGGMVALELTTLEPPNKGVLKIYRNMHRAATYTYRSPWMRGARIFFFGGGGKGVRTFSLVILKLPIARLYIVH